tara:strand:- start:372 stop:728 length:357 start_codon:yes stop_codon:yes gene_type:complete
VIKKIIIGLYDLLGLPYYAVLNFIKGLIFAVKKTIKGFTISAKWTLKNIVKFIKSIPSLLVIFGKWLIDVIKESIAQIFTLLGFFIAWFTLTGTAQDIVGIAIVVSTAIWLLTIRLRD